MTLRELAKLTNVSVPTVSKAFHDADDINEETKKMIFEAAKKYGCFGKYYKGKYAKQIIAVICPELRSNYYTEYVEKLQSLIEQDNGIILISTDAFQSRKQAELIEYYVSYLHVNGIFIFDLRTPIKKGYDTPIVSLLAAKEPSVDAICIDMETPIHQAISYLKSLHHQKIAFIGEKLTLLKEDCFRKMMEQNGLEVMPGHIVISEYRFEKAGEDGMAKLLEQECTPTAVFCAYDYIASGAIKYLSRNGYSVPENFSVIGMDNICASKYMEKPLTSIDFNPDEICSIAWDLLQKKMNNNFYQLRQKIIVSGKLVIRDTAAPI